MRIYLYIKKKKKKKSHVKRLAVGVLLLAYIYRLQFS